MVSFANVVDKARCAVPRENVLDKVVMSAVSTGARSSLLRLGIRHAGHLMLAAWLTLSLSSTAVFSAETAPAKVQFNRDIRPILSDKCFQCHGPDAKKRQADLRLDVRDVAVATGAITPDRPQESSLLKRVVSVDEDERMPPSAANLERLSDAEVETLRLWIEQGAEYENHWSFISLRPVDVPGDGGGSPIDALIADSLAKRGLARQPEADRSTLIRRLSFDLTGLPPTPAEIDRFIADDAPEAYDRLVDRLLASEHYGERMAVDWLDAARYADSYGFQVDRERAAWPWRDWVVRSLNANLPFDQFITWQLAGDLLPDASDEQVLATAFNRLNQQECEGGSVEEEYRVEGVCDRVQTFATAFLGLTFECARCHDHKYDPITQREFYQLFAMFQNIDEAGLYSYFTPSTPTPALSLPDPTAKERLALLEQKVAQVEGQTAELRAARGEAFDGWLASLHRSPDGPGTPKTTDGQSAAVLAPGEVGRFDFEQLEKNNELVNAIAPIAAGRAARREWACPGQTRPGRQIHGRRSGRPATGKFRPAETVLHRALVEHA